MEHTGIEVFARGVALALLLGWLAGALFIDLRAHWRARR